MSVWSLTWGRDVLPVAGGQTEDIGDDLAGAQAGLVVTAGQGHQAQQPATTAGVLAIA